MNSEIATRGIDAHHHFWRYTPEEYGWIRDDMVELRRDFLPADLQNAVRGANIEGVVSVQARQSIEETNWLLSLADRHSFVSGVVGWLPIAADDFPAQLEKFGAQPKLKGLRHVIQDEPDCNYILRPDFNRGISTLKSTQLVYDILILGSQLRQAIEFVDRHPNQRFVLDHMAKPRIRQGILEPWRENITELAKRNNVYCKVSGMVTEADWKTWSKENLRPYVDVVMESFGPERLMAGSDWPVCLVATTYARWFETLTALLNELSATERRRIMGENATKVYRL